MHYERAKDFNRRVAEVFWRHSWKPRYLLERLACAPPIVKGRTLRRFAQVGLEVGGYAENEEFFTNFAVARGPKVRLPVSCGAPYLFGNPAATFGEGPAIRLCRALLSDSAAFVDIGAHLGLYLWSLLDLLSASRPGYFFEPHPDLFGILDSNAARIGSFLHGYEAALDDHDGRADFYVNREDWSMSTLTDDPDSGDRVRRIEVACMTFDTFARDVGLRDALVKADVEEAEDKLVAGMADSGEAVRDLVSEVLEPAFVSGAGTNMAARLGRDPYVIREKTLDHAAGITEWRWSERNWLFTTRSADALQTIVRPFGFDVVR